MALDSIKPREEPRDPDLVRYAEAMFNVDSPHSLDNRARNAQGAQRAILLIAHYLQGAGDAEAAMLADTAEKDVSSLLAGAELEYAVSQEFRDKVGMICEQLGLYGDELRDLEKKRG